MIGRTVSLPCLFPVRRRATDLTLVYRLWRWVGMALGPRGAMPGWAPFV